MNVSATHFDLTSWRPWNGLYSTSELDSPYAWRQVEIHREGEGEIYIVDPNKLHPWFNVWGLRWQPRFRLFAPGKHLL